MTGKKVTLFQCTKNYKQIVNNYQQVSVLPISSKIFEKLIPDSICDFINKNNLFNKNQSQFSPNDSYIDQLIAITNNIFSTFDANLHWKFVALSLIYLNHSVEFGMTVSFINSSNKININLSGGLTSPHRNQLMPYNIFPTERNFPTRSRYVFYFFFFFS